MIQCHTTNADLLRRSATFLLCMEYTESLENEVGQMKPVTVSSSVSNVISGQGSL